MSSSTLDKAASNGTIPNDDTAQQKRLYGICRVHDQVVLSLSGLAESALVEAEHLVAEVERTASKRVFDHDGSKGTEALDTARMAEVIGETLDCLAVAAEHLFRLIEHFRTDQDQQPF